jgi:hypothetical protein
VFTHTSSAIEAFDSTDSNTHVGSNVTAAGDVSGDGDDDLLIGASWTAHDGHLYAGATYLLCGPVSSGGDLDASAQATLYGDANYAGYYSSARGSDLDGDGYSDIVLGLPWMYAGTLADAGGLAVFPGPVSGEMTTASADTLIEGTASHARLGWAVAIVDDQDGDGYREILASEYQADSGALTEAGAVHLWSGDLTPGTTIDSSSAVATWEGIDDDQHAGSAVSTGDFDGDGTPDVVIGASGGSASSLSAGTVYIDYGPLGGTSDVDDLDAVFHGEAADDGAGFSLGAGDVNGDGYDDFFAGAPGYDDAVRANAGRGYLWYGLGF